SFDWFILSIDLLYLLDLIELKGSFIKRKHNVK
ncbi:ABC-three component system middle component 6, partial [Vibrio vulnificus]